MDAHNSSRFGENSAEEEPKKKWRKEKSLGKGREGKKGVQKAGSGKGVKGIADEGPVGTVGKIDGKKR